MSRKRRFWIIGLCLLYFAAQTASALYVQLKWTEDAAIYGSFWEAGKHLDYAFHPLVWVKNQIAEINLNPPVLLPLFQIFALFDPQAGQPVWLLISSALYLAGAFALRRADTLQLVWLLTFPLATSGLAIGQVYVLLFLIGIGIHAALSAERAKLAAVLVGVLIALKPNFALWALAAFAAGYRREATIAGLVALGLSLLPAALYGPQVYVEWFTAVTHDTHYRYPYDVSVAGFLKRFEISGSTIAVVSGVVLTLVWALRHRRSVTLYDLTPVALIAAMLSAPLAWLDYILVTVPFILDRPWRLPMLFATFLIYVFPLALTVELDNMVPVFAISAICLVSIGTMLASFLKRAAGEDLGKPVNWSNLLRSPTSTLSLAD